MGCIMTTSEKINKYLQMSKEQEQSANTNVQEKIKFYLNQSNNDVTNTIDSFITRNEKKEEGNFFSKIGSTIGDVATNIGRGFLNTVEGAVDLGRYGVAGVADFFGADKYANDVRERAKQDTTSLILKPADDLYNKHSVLKEGGIVEGVAQGIGNVGAMLGGGALLGKASTVGKYVPTTSLISGAGSGMTEAYNNGATDGQAVAYGAMSGLTESLSEAMFSGLGSKFSKVYGGGALDDVFIKKVTDKISNKAVQTLTQSGLKAVGEGFEEVVSGLGNAFAKKLTYMNDEKITKLLSDEKLLDSFIVGTLTSTIMQTPGTINSIKTGNDYIPTQTNQNISNNTNIPNENIQNGINRLTNETNVETGTKYSYLPTNNEKSNNLRQSASNYFNNSQETINMIDTIDKVIQDKGYNILFDNTITNTNGQSVNAQIKTLDNGEVEIRINPNSPRAGEFLLCHEITHAIETDNMKQLVIDYASKNTEFNQALESLKQTYGTNEITSEVLADISGQLFGNREFINSLSMQQPNVFKRIYNKIIELANKITGNSNEALFIKDLKNKWETAYRTQNNNLNNEIKFSTIGLKGANNLSKNSDSRYYKNLLNNQEIASEIFNNSDETLENTNIKSKRETGWFQTKYGDWGTLISDKNSRLMQKLEPNRTYRLGDILEHELLYQAYPELKKLKVKTSDIDSTGGYASLPLLPANTITNEIYIRNSDLNKKDFRKTLLHEINHYIEHKENYDKRSIGASSKIDGKEGYRNNLGELISNETKINADLTQEELDAIILPEQAKKNPQYKNIREKLLESNKNDLLKNGDDNSALQNLELPIQNKIKNNKVANKKDNKSRRIVNDMEELDNSSFSYDNKGRTLTKEQQEYFKDSKVRDENGNLLTVYHGTNNDFTIFENEFIGKNTNNEGIFGKGFYFTEKKSLADNYNRKDGKLAKDGSGKTMELYLDMKNPFYWNDIETKEKMEAFIEETGMPKYVVRWNNTLKNQMAPITDIKAERKFSEILQKNGYDGVIYKYDDAVGEYVVFNSNQIKNIDNTNPTSNKDIRYSEQNNKWQQHLEKNYKATGTRTDMRKNLYPLETTQTENKTVEKLPTAKRNIPQDPTKESTYDDVKKTRKDVQQELQSEMGITIDDISKGNDISSIDLSRTDPIRVNEKVFGAELGQKINDATINKSKHNEAERTRWLNNERSEIKSLGIKAGSKESEAVQKYGEKQYITRNNEVIPYGDEQLAKDFPNVEIQNKIKKAAQIIRNKYDKYIEQINEVLVDMGYSPIKKRNDYMRHFQALNDVFSRFGIPLNKESMQNDSLPTDINGLTDQFKPGKQYFANAMQRLGMRTEYDAITGIDGYLEGASNLIYHTEDIQRYRALSKMVRDSFGAKHGFDDFESMSVEQQEQRISDIQSNKLAKYAAWLDEQANALAGKKGKIDRGAEELFGRKVYTVLQTAKKQVGSNMTGYNVRSALTNFASAIQGASKTNKIAFLKGTISTVNNIVHNDDLINKSDFLTNRFGSDSLSPKLWQKMSNAGQIFMKGSDYFTANQVWRSKYYENLSNGMSESEAIRRADDFASRVMGDRSKGSTATIFNSNTLGFLTQFQLEVNNQWSSLIHDNKMDVQRGNKTGASVVFQLGQLFAMSYLFNNMMKSLTGSGVMIDPIELLKKIFNPDDDEKTLEERTTEVLGEVVNNIPFASIFTGGRIPISEAFEGISTGFKYATGQTDEYGNKYTLSDVKDDMIESAFYWLLPTGYGQAKKTIKGASMYSGKLPTAGSYTASGNLRFTADESAGGKAKALLFGQYSSKEAQNYIDSGFKTISKNHIQEMKDLGMTSTEYRKYRTGLSKAGTTNSEKLDYINNLNVSIEQKNIMAHNVVDSEKYTVDMSNYNDYGSYDAMKYAMGNPANYSIITSITKYDNYLSHKDEVNSIKERYSGTEKSTVRKQKVFEYINSLPYNKAQKIILFKMLGNYSISDYQNDVFNYLNGLKISKYEKEQMWKQIYGK